VLAVPLQGCSDAVLRAGVTQHSILALFNVKFVI